MKPFVVDAVQIDPKAEHPFAAAMAFTKELGTSRVVTTHDGQPVSLHIYTPEGIMQANLGDWIIKGVWCLPDRMQAALRQSSATHCDQASDVEARGGKVTQYPGSYPAVHEARRALSALYLEVPAVVADGVKAKVEAAFKEILDDREKVVEILRTSVRGGTPEQEQSLREVIERLSKQ